MFQLTVPDINL